MASNPATQVFKKAHTSLCANGFVFCKKVILMNMLFGSKDVQLLDKEVDILSCMCKMQIEGKDPMKVSDIMKEMQVCGIEPVAVGTLKNYKTWIRNKGWLDGRKLHGRLRHAIADGGSAVGIFLERR